MSTTNPISFDPASTALVLIDLQHSNVARELAPHSAQQVVNHSVQLAEAMRQRGGTVVYVRVLIQELLHLPADVALSRPASAPQLPENATELVPQAGYKEADIVVAKRQWGAFLRTDLHEFSIKNIFPFMGKVRSTADLLSSLAADQR